MYCTIVYCVTHKAPVLASQAEAIVRTDVVKYCQYYFGFDLPSTVWLKRVQKFEAKFKECDNLFCKLTVCK